MGFSALFGYPANQETFAAPVQISVCAALIGAGHAAISPSSWHQRSHWRHLTTDRQRTEL
jgi:hypothetical protein